MSLVKDCQKSLIFNLFLDQKQRKHAITFDIVVMENLQQNDYELIILDNYGKFLQTFYRNLKENKENPNLTIMLYNMCMDWLIALKNKYLIQADQYYSFDFKCQVEACIYIYSRDSYFK